MHYAKDEIVQFQHFVIPAVFGVLTRSSLTRSTLTTAVGGQVKDSVQTEREHLGDDSHEKVADTVDQKLLIDQVFFQGLLGDPYTLPKQMPQCRQPSPVSLGYRNFDAGDHKQCIYTHLGV